MSGYRAPLTSSYRAGGPTLKPGFSRPPESTSTVAQSSASRSGFSQPSGVTAVPSWMREVRWVAAARTATGEEMPYWRWRWRTQAESSPSDSPCAMRPSVDSWPARGEAGSKRPIVRKPSLLSRGSGRTSGGREEGAGAAPLRRHSGKRKPSRAASNVGRYVCHLAFGAARYSSYSVPSFALKASSAARVRTPPSVYVYSQ
ncbi:hypothetical protein GA0115246_111183 [Streptomyces sp. SolWspMP-sol7th]|nr:hypothetical protein GA0115246_111183 [Streptomyces sp. SolWspMP-sol7th]